MGIAISLQQYLSDHHISYDEVVHKRTGCSARTAHASHVPADCLAKAVVLRRKEGFLLAVIPASSRVALEEVGRCLQQPVGLAAEDEISALFPDCEAGAVPPIAAAYGLGAIVEESLEGKPDVYFEAGDHRTLVHVTGAEFHRLMENIPHAHITARS